MRQPEELIPGKPLFYATAMPFAGSGVGLLVESHEGRPTKIEGNPDHPSSLGATDLFAQAAILGLYDPDRSQVLTHLGEIRTFDGFAQAIRQVLDAQQGSQGSGIRILSETVASPTLGSQIDEFLARFPRARWIQWEPFGGHNVRAGSRLAFGEYVDAKYSFEKADVILSLDADFLCTGNGRLTHSRAYASRRGIEGDRAQRNRLYSVESSPSNTGTKADHRLLLRASDVAAFARAVAAQVGVAGAAGAVPESAQAWMGPLVKDLQNARGRSLVVAGEGQPAAVHALAHAMNEALGNVGNTVVYTQSVETHPMDQRASLAELVGEMNAGTVGLLLILGGNPVYTAPSDLKFAEAMDKVTLRANLSQFHDETAALCHWHIPETHFLEMWSDVRGHDGTATIVQPLISPLYNGHSVHEVVSTLSAAGVRSGYDIVRSYWGGQRGAAPAPAAQEPVAGSLAPLPGSTALSPFDKEWRRWLHDGVIPDTAFATTVVTLQGGAVGSAPAAAPAGLEVVFRPDPSVYDGRFVNNGWLQELPKWLTKLTWDNAALLSPGTADRLNLVSGDVVEVKQGSNTVRIPVWLAPGHAADTITIHLGYGRERAGRIGTGIGFSVNPLRTSAAHDVLTGVQVTKTGDSYELVSTQDHWSLEGRNLVRVATVEQYAQDPNFAAKQEHQPLVGLTMFEARKYEGYAWGMAIDQNVCTGCNACVVACQAENNVPVVGKSQVAERPRDALAAARPLLQRRPREPGYLPSADAVSAVRVRAVRGRVPRRRDDAQRRRPERHGLQPLRRHAVLLEQLSVQGSSLQLPAVFGLGHGQLQAGAQSRRHRAQPRRDGEVHLLRAADQSRARDGQARGSTDPRRRSADGLPVGVSDRSHRVRQHQRSDQRGVEAQSQPAELPAARRAQHSAADHVSGHRAESQYRARTCPAARVRRRKDTRDGQVARSRWRCRRRRRRC